MKWFSKETPVEMKGRGRAVVTAFAVAIVLGLGPSSQAILNGTPDGNGHPYAGGVDVRPTGFTIPASGVLVSPTVYVTAGHVGNFFTRRGITQARVTFDAVVDYDNGTFYTGDIHVNPDYTGQPDDQSDMAVIVFAEPIPGITPAELPTKNYLGGLHPQQLRSETYPAVGYASRGCSVVTKAAVRWGSTVQAGEHDALGRGRSCRLTATGSDSTCTIRRAVSETRARRISSGTLVSWLGSVSPATATASTWGRTSASTQLGREHSLMSSSTFPDRKHITQRSTSGGQPSSGRRSALGARRMRAVVDDGEAMPSRGARSRYAPISRTHRLR